MKASMPLHVHMKRPMNTPCGAASARICATVAGDSEMHHVAPLPSWIALITMRHSTATTAEASECLPTQRLRDNKYT